MGFSLRLLARCHHLYKLLVFFTHALPCHLPACLPARPARPSRPARPTRPTCPPARSYHVHEKAVLMVTVPLGVLAAAGLMPDAGAAAAQFFFLSTLGTYSLFPLLFEPREYPVKARACWGGKGGERGCAVNGVLVCSSQMGGGSGLLLRVLTRHLSFIPCMQVLLLVTFNLIAARCLPQATAPAPSSHRKRGKKDGSTAAASAELVLSWRERAYLWGLVPLELCCSWLLPALPQAQRLPFLPLMAVSLYCSLGMLYCWARMAARYLRTPSAAAPTGG